MIPTEADADGVERHQSESAKTLFVDWRTLPSDVVFVDEQFVFVVETFLVY